jgi:aminopeptidase
MKTAFGLAVFGATLVMFSPPAGHAAGPSGSDLDRIAGKLATHAAIVKEGDLVLVEGGARDLELLQDIAVQVRKAGAFPLLNVTGDRLTRRLFDDVPAKFDAQEPKLGLRIAESFDVIIAVDDNDDPGLLKHIAPERQLARGKAYQSIVETMNRRSVRRVYVGNGLYPTAANARLLGIQRPQLERLFWTSLNVDYGELTARGQSLKALLASGKEVRITNRNGTNLRVGIEGRAPYVSDGIISEDKVQRGGAATIVFLPAGEVYVVPVPGTAEGTVFAERVPFEDTIIEGLTLTFKAGKLTSMKARKGGERLQALYDAAGPRKDEFAAIDFGINARAKGTKGLVPFIPAGMVTIAIGNNAWAGGDNQGAFLSLVYLPGSNATLDGVSFIENGELKVPQAAAAR